MSSFNPFNITSMRSELCVNDCSGRLSQGQAQAAGSGATSGTTIREVKKEHKHQHQQQSGEECSICMEELDNGKNIAKTNCGHSFCLSCLVRALKNNNTCPMCRANIEEEKPKNTTAIGLDDCVELIKEEMDMFPYKDHLDAITMFDNPTSSLKSMLRVFGVGLAKSIINFQNQELENENIYEEEEDDEEAEDEEASGEDGNY
jgi:hypothetical protein